MIEPFFIGAGDQQLWPLYGPFGIQVDQLKKKSGPFVLAEGGIMTSHSPSSVPRTGKKVSRKSKASLNPLELKMLEWLSQVHDECLKLLDTSTPGRDHHTFDYAAYGAWAIRAKLCLRELLGGDHEYVHEFSHIIDDTYSSESFKVEKASHFLSAIRTDMEAGYLRGYRGLIQAELFCDFLDMATHLYEQGFKDASAVIAGSVLEDHLKKLCQKHGISMIVKKQNGDERPMTASEVSEALGKTKVYELPQQQAIKGWLALRNNAAHGKYATYNLGEVDLLIKGIRQFICTFPL